MDKLRHIALSVEDPEAAAQFFEQAFGMRRAGNAMRGIYMTDGTMNVALLNFKDETVPGYAAESWYGLFAPAKTPPDVIDRLNKSAATAVQAESFKKLGVNEGLVMVAQPPQQLRAPPANHPNDQVYRGDRREEFSKAQADAAAAQQEDRAAQQK